MKISEIRQKIEITPAFLAFLCAFFYFDPAGSFFPFLLAATLHEAAHLLALRLLSARVHKLCLSACGAVLQTEPLSYGKELLAAAAGPAANLLLALLFAKRAPIFALVNLCLLLFNLLPLYPLDGGRILRAALLLLLPVRAAEIAEKCIVVLSMLALTAFSCYLTCAWHAGLWPVIICGLLFVRIAGTVFPTRGRFLCRNS